MWLMGLAMAADPMSVALPEAPVSVRVVSTSSAGGHCGVLHIVSLIEVQADPLVPRLPTWPFLVAVSCVEFLGVVEPGSPLSMRLTRTRPDQPEPMNRGVFHPDRTWLYGLEVHRAEP